MGRRPRASNETLIELFLDMIAAERGASRNTLDAYRRDLADFSADLPGRRTLPPPTAMNCAPSWTLAKRGLAPRPWRGASRQSASFIGSLQRRPPLGRSGRRDRGAEARPRLPKVLSVQQVDNLLAKARDGMKARRNRNGCVRRG